MIVSAADAVAFAEAFPLVVWRRCLGVWAFLLLLVVVAGYFVWLRFSKGSDR